GPFLLVRGRFCSLGRDPRRLARVALLDEVEVRPHLAPQLRRGERDGPSVLAQDPRGELPEIRVACDEDAVLDPAVAPEQAVDPPRRVAGNLDLRLTLRLADLPRRPLAVVLGVETLGEAEVALAARGQPDLPADPRDTERLDPLVVEVEA